MQDNRNTSLSSSSFDARGTVCIDTKRVLDCCKDRDCYEDARVYLTAYGEEVLSTASNVRSRTAKLLWAYVGVDKIPFNCGFYQVTVRYYIEIEFEACIGMGRSQNFTGIAILEKNVVLFGGEGSVTSFTSGPENNYCCPSNVSVGNTDPVAIVETVEPLVLRTKVECNCTSCTECVEIPPAVCDLIDGELQVNGTGPRIYVSFGIFSVIRIVRPAQLLVQASDYSVPDKECTASQSDDNPCTLFRSIAFPTAQFRGNTCPETEPRERTGGCGCNKER